MSFFFQQHIFKFQFFFFFLSTNRKQTVYTTGGTPTALSIHKVEMNVSDFNQRVPFGPLGFRFLIPHALVDKDVLQWCRWLWLRGEREESSTLWRDCAVHHFQTDNQLSNDYGSSSTVDTTLFLLLHTQGQQAFCRFSKVGMSREWIVLTIYIWSCVYVYLCIIVHIYI